jgi:hypothetical protein
LKLLQEQNLFVYAVAVQHKKQWLQETFGKLQGKELPALEMEAMMLQ